SITSSWRTSFAMRCSPKPPVRAASLRAASPVVDLVCGAGAGLFTDVVCLSAQPTEENATRVTPSNDTFQFRHINFGSLKEHCKCKAGVSRGNPKACFAVCRPALWRYSFPLMCTRLSFKTASASADVKLSTFAEMFIEQNLGPHIEQK